MEETHLASNQAKVLGMSVNVQFEQRASETRYEHAVISIARYFAKLGIEPEVALERGRQIVARVAEQSGWEQSWRDSVDSTIALDRLALLLAMDETLVAIRPSVQVVPIGHHRPMRPAAPNRLVAALRRDSYSTLFGRLNQVRLSFLFRRKG